jgi:hypothetical protein
MNLRHHNSRSTSGKFQVRLSSAIRSAGRSPSAKTKRFRHDYFLSISDPPVVFLFFMSPNSTDSSLQLKLTCTTVPLDDLIKEFIKWQDERRSRIS